MTNITRQQLATAIVLVAALVTSAADALAEETSPEREEPLSAEVRAIERFSWLEMVRAGTGADFTRARLNSQDDEDYKQYQFHLQWMSQWSVGAFASADVLEAQLTDEFMPGGFDTTRESFGNLELGGFYVYGLNPRSELVLRGSAVLPTSSDEATTKYIARFTDAARGAYDTTWARASASTTYRRGYFFARTDVGVDVPLATSERVDAVLLHANAGAGLRWGYVAATLEFVHLKIFNSVEGPYGLPPFFDGSFNEVALSLRAGALGASGFVSVGVPSTSDSDAFCLFSFGFTGQL